MLKAVILAAGNGTRMQPLTFTKPKALMKVLGKTVLEHNLDQLNGLLEEVVIITGYKGDMIRSLIGEKYGKMKIIYKEQERLLGTGDAAGKAKGHLNDKFLLLCGDDIYSGEDIKEILSRFPSILLGKTDDPSSFGVVECANSHIKSLTEKPKGVIKEGLVNTGLYFLPKSILDFKVEKSARGEYEFTDYITKFISGNKLYFKQAECWIPVSYPWDLLRANEALLEKLREKGKAGKNCSISGKVKMEEGVIIKPGTCIEGPAYIGKNSVIGPNSFIRGNTVIGENCRIGNAVEIKNSVIGNNTLIAHLNYVGDSVIGDNCNLGAGTVLANLRFDKKNVKVRVGEKKIDTKREKLGAVMGDNVSVGINSSLMPGVTVGSGAIIGPHLLVKKNIGKDEKYYG